MTELSAKPYSQIGELPIPLHRLPEAKGRRGVPDGTVVVSMDNHFSVAEDIWHQRFPDRLRDKAPRVWEKGGVWHIGFGGKSLVDASAVGFGSFDTRPGSFDLVARLQDLTDEGIDKEVVYGNASLALLFHPDLTVREWIFRVYNEYMAELQEKSGRRFYGVGYINYWDLKKTRESIVELKALGLKTFLLPIDPKLDSDGEQIQYSSDKMESLWGAIEESGMPIAFHIGENTTVAPYNAVAISVLRNLAPFRKVVGEMIFGGILDRHPKLRMSFAEGGINWVASMLQDADLAYASLHRLFNRKLEHEPGYYWHNHMYAGFMMDPLGMKLLDIVGADRVMWSSDYPHPESTLGYGWTAIEAVVDAVSDSQAKMILGGTARSLYDI